MTQCGKMKKRFPGWLFSKLKRWVKSHLNSSEFKQLMSLVPTWITSLVAVGWFSKRLGLFTASSLTRFLWAFSEHTWWWTHQQKASPGQGSPRLEFSGGGDLSLRLEGRFPLKHRARKPSRASDHSLFLHFTSVNGCLYPGWGPLGLLQERKSSHMTTVSQGQEVSAGAGLRDRSGSGLVGSVGTSAGWSGALSHKVL